MLHVLAVRDKETDLLLGIAPLVVSMRKIGLIPVRVLEFMGLGEVCSDHLDLISMPGKEAEVSSCFFGYLRQHQDEWDIVNLDRMAVESPLMKHFKNKAKEAFLVTEETVAVCPYVLLPSSWAEFLTFLEGSFRKKVLYYLRRLRKDFDFRLEQVHDAGALKAAMQRLYQLHDERWVFKGKVGALGSATLLSKFHDEIAAVFFA